MLKTITFKKEHRCFKKGRKLTFLPGVNVLVGDQGTGKSTIIQLLRDLSGGSKWGKYKQNEAKAIIDIEVEGDNPVMAFDFEKDNPRIQSHFGDNMMAQVAAIFSSHGEVVRHLLRAFTELETPTLVLFDEPDTGLSVRSICKFRDDLKEAETKGHQIIISAHNPVLIGSFEKVFSLEHKRWMTSKKFFEHHGLDKNSLWS